MEKESMMQMTIDGSSVPVDASGKRKDLESINAELGVLLRNDRTNWIAIYRLLESVKSAELWRGEYPSYSQYIKFISKRFGIHESSIWSKAKAGSTYVEFEKRCEQNGIVAPLLEETKLSTETLVLIDKIAGKDDKQADILINKAVDGELTRRDLKDAWSVIRSEREPRKNAHSERAEVNENQVVTADMMVALTRGYSEFIPYASFKGRFERKVDAFTELPVDTGTAHHARRMDLCFAENISTTNVDELRIRCVEIKVSKADLEGDHKMSEYCDFCDYFYIAVPQNLVPCAEAIALSEWGIMSVIKDGEGKFKVEVVKDAQFKEGIMRDKTLTRMIMKRMRAI